MADTGKDAEGFTEVGKGGKTIKVKNETEGEGIIVIRLEHIEYCEVVGEGTYNSTRAIEEAIKSIVNNDEGNVLAAFDGKSYISKMTYFPNETMYKRFVKTIEVSSNDKRSIRYSAVFKIRTTTEFYELVTTEQVKKITEEYKCKLFNHKLGTEQVEAKLIYNVFNVNPYFTSKTEFETDINTKIKKFVTKEASQEVRNKLTNKFCSYVKNTENNIVEIGKRYWRSEFEGDDDDVHEVECVVFTIKCGGDYFVPIKETIKSIQWEDDKFGKFKVENPKNNSTKDMIVTAYEHNSFCNTGAYVKLSDLPTESFQIKIDSDKSIKTLEQHIMEKKTKDNNKMFKSINRMNKQQGTFYLVTTEEMLDEAEYFIQGLINIVNYTKEHTDNLTKIEHTNRFVSIIKRKSDDASQTGSVASEFGKQEDMIVPMNVVKPEHNKMIRRGKKNVRGPPMKKSGGFKQTQTTQEKDMIGLVIETKPPTATATIATNKKQIKEMHHQPKATTLANATTTTGQTSTTLEADSSLTDSKCTMGELLEKLNNMDANLKRLQDDHNKAKEENKQLKEAQKMMEDLQRKLEAENSGLLAKQEVWINEVSNLRYERTSLMNEIDEIEIANGTYAKTLFESPMPAHRAKKGRDNEGSDKRVSYSPDTKEATETSTIADQDGQPEFMSPTIRKKSTSKLALIKQK
jgi:hypothetical protein